MSKPSRANWFVGLPVPAGRWFSERVRDPPPGTRLFSPGDLHLTVAFLGPVGAAAARRAWNEVPPLLSGFGASPMDATLGGVVPPGHPLRPSALSALLDQGNDAVIALIAALRGRLLRLAGARPDRRAPKPHLTLARPGRRATDAERNRAVAWSRELDLAGVPVHLDRIALYTWADDRRRVLFRIVDEAPLRAG